MSRAVSRLVCARLRRAAAVGRPVPVRAARTRGSGDDVDHVLGAIARPRRGRASRSTTPTRTRSSRYRRCCTRTTWRRRRRHDATPTSSRSCGELDERSRAVDGHGFARHAVRAAPTRWRPARASSAAAASGSRTRPATSPARTRPGTCSACSLQLEVGGARSGSPTRIGGPTSRSPAAATRRWRRPSWPPRRERRSRCSSHPTPTRRSSSGSSELGAQRHVCPREPGVRRRSVRPRARARRSRRARSRSPCQGNLNGLASRAASTLGVGARGAAGGGTLDRLFVQVGGGALASACVARAARGGGARRDRDGCRGSTRCRRAARAPLRARVRRASRRARRRRLREARTAREFMWPWEEEPHERRPRHPRRRDLRLARASSRGCSRPAARPSSSTRTTLLDGERARPRGDRRSTSTTRARPASPGCSPCAPPASSAATSAWRALHGVAVPAPTIERTER